MNRAEAIKLCEKYRVDHSVHPHIVVTANGNIYLTGKVDPADKSEQIKLNGEQTEQENNAPEPITETKTGKKHLKK